MAAPGVRFVFDRSLTALAYRCWPDGCRRGRTCCFGLVLELSRREVRVIDSLMDQLARVVPRLRDGRGYRNVFVEDPPGYVVDHDEHAGCPFIVRTKTHVLCGIHATALATGRRVDAVKPAACRHWPVTLEPDGARVRVTVQAAARHIGCVAPRRELPGHPTVLEAFRPELEELCGAAARGLGQAHRGNGDRRNA
jgi:hypothetical protein